MSVEPVPRKGGKVWRVRWREGEKERSKVVGRKRDAEAVDAELRRLKRLGQLAQMDAGRERVSEFAEEWWRLHAVPNLAPKTRDVYASVFDTHLLPRVGGLTLRDVTPVTVARLRADLEAAGVGPAATRKALAVLQSIFSRAVEWGHVATNPVAAVKKPPGRRQRSVTPPSPIVVEHMRADLRHDRRLRDATLICVLAYAGLRPQEALALSWERVRERTLLIDRALSNGVEKPTKTAQERRVRLLPPLAADLAEWRLASGRPDPASLVFPNNRGRPWTEDDWRNWRRRTFASVAARAGLTGARPYDLRHAFVSLLIHDGRSVLEVARQAGHSPTMTLNTYGGIFDELDGAERVSAEAAIRAARGESVSEKCPPSLVPGAAAERKPL